jgi:hypothetical protein
MEGCEHGGAAIRRAGARLPRYEVGEGCGEIDGPHRRRLKGGGAFAAAQSRHAGILASR